MKKSKTNLFKKINLITILIQNKIIYYYTIKKKINKIRDKFYKKKI